MPLELDAIYDHLAACDLFLSIGTSGTVYPAAGFVDMVRHHNAQHFRQHFRKPLTVELNLEPSAGESKFDRKIYGKARETVPAFVDDLLNLS